MRFQEMIIPARFASGFPDPSRSLPLYPYGGIYITMAAFLVAPVTPAVNPKMILTAIPTIKIMINNDHRHDEQL